MCETCLRSEENGVKENRKEASKLVRKQDLKNVSVHGPNPLHLKVS